MKKIYSKATKEQAVIKWEQSGLSKSAFSQQEGVPYSTFQRWSVSYCKDRIQSVSSPVVKGSEEFVPLELCSSSSITQSLPTELTLHYPNGVKLSGLGSLSPSELRTLIEL